MDENIKKPIIKYSGFGTLEETPNPNDPTSSIYTGGAATPEAARVIAAAVQESAIKYNNNRPYSIRPLEPDKSASINAWFRYYYDCEKSGEPYPHDVIRQKYNANCDPSRRIEKPATWRRKYIRWKDKNIKE